MMGELRDRAFAGLLSEAAFLWHPAMIDNGSFTVIESAMRGVPALSSDYPAMREIDENFRAGAEAGWTRTTRTTWPGNSRSWNRMPVRNAWRCLARAALEAHSVERLAATLVGFGARMPVTRYGIYLFYRPTASLRDEGLGRYLSAISQGGAGTPGHRAGRRLPEAGCAGC